MTATTEAWRPVLGYEGYYEVSDLGRVRSLDRTTDNGRGVLRRLRGRVLKVQANPVSGRRVVRLSRDGDGRVQTIYPLVLTAFVGPRPPGMEACHNDGNPSNDRLDNLRWDTSGANNRDGVQHGTHYQARKTHCPREHPLVHGNLIPSALAKGKRSCLTCAIARRRTT